MIISTVNYIVKSLQLCLINISEKKLDVLVAQLMSTIFHCCLEEQRRYDRTSQWMVTKKEIYALLGM